MRKPDKMDVSTPTVLAFDPNRPRAVAQRAVSPRLTSSPNSPTISEVVERLRLLALKDPHGLQAVFLFLDESIGIEVRP